MTPRIGAACKWLNDDGSSLKEATFKTTTVRYLTGQDQRQRNEVLIGLLQHNLAALKLQILLASKRKTKLRMWRIGSDLLPLYTHPIAQNFYASNEVKDLIASKLAWCGKLARRRQLRMSFHPGQFVVLGSANPDIRERSLVELQYHCDAFTLMGYDKWHEQGACVNIHVGLKEPNIKALRKALQSSSAVSNFVTLENDEFSWGAQRIVETFGDLVPVVLDVHHHWIETGERLTADSALTKSIIETWRGVRPKLHFAMSDEELCSEVDRNVSLNLQELLDSGKTKAKLRIHSQSAWHTPSIDYVATFLPDFDIMWEGKNKNLGAIEIQNYLDSSFA